MKWTKEPPKVPGWYWRTFKGGNKSWPPVVDIIRIFEMDGHLCYEPVAGIARVDGPESKGMQWSDGPIPEPQKIS